MIFFFLIPTTDCVTRGGNIFNKLWNMMQHISALRIFNAVHMQMGEYASCSSGLWNINTCHLLYFLHVYQINMIIDT